MRDYLRLKLVAEPNEIFAVVFSTARQVLAFEPLFKGTVDQTSVYPVVVQRALALSASALIWRISTLGNTASPRPPIVRSPSG